MSKERMKTIRGWSAVFFVVTGYIAMTVACLLNKLALICGKKAKQIANKI